MGIEYEYQFPIKSQLDILKKIKKLKLKEVHKRVKYNVLYLYFLDNSGFYRVRDENGLITITKKIFRKNKHSIEHEIELKEGTKMKDAINFLKEIVEVKYREISIEKYRQKWSIGSGCHELVLDEWPGLPPYIEIDCKSQKELDNVIKKLGLNNSKYYTKGAFDFYEDYYGLKDRSVLFNLNLKFKTIGKTLKKYVTKNKVNLDKHSKKYKNNKNYNI